MNPRMILAASAVLSALAVAGCASDASPSLPPTPVAAPVAAVAAAPEEVVPEACLLALDEADDIVAISAEFAEISATAFGLAADGIEAAIYMDIVGLERVADGLEPLSGQIADLTARIDANRYPELSAQCRSAAR